MLHHDLKVLITEHSPKHVEISRHKIKVVAELNSLSAWFIVAGMLGFASWMWKFLGILSFVLCELIFQV